MQHICEYLINRKLTAKDHKHRLIPSNEIWYEADEKLNEYKGDLPQEGLHINSFNCNIISHTFNNGKGVITFKDDIIKIGKYAFFWCENLTSINMPNTITSIENSAFRGCTGLTSINIPDSVTSIGGWAFLSCKKIESISIPKSIAKIEKSTFGGCVELKSITIPNSVSNIGNYIFHECNNLKEIIYDGTIKQWNNIIKDNEWKSQLNPNCIIKCIDGDIKIEES